MDSNFLTPVGRIVSGNLFKPNTTDYYNKPCDPYWFFKLAIPKNDPGWPALEAQIHQVAMDGHPACFPGGVLNRPDFAMKIDDGDSTVPNKKGILNCNREGFPGNWILSFRTQLKAPEVFENGGTVPIIDPTRVKCGDFVEVYGNCSANNSLENPGVYINPDLVGFVAYGQPISHGPDAATVLAGQRALPAGASATPLSASAAPTTQAHPQSAAVVVQPYTPTPATATAAPVSQVQPVTSFVQGPYPPGSVATLPNMATAPAAPEVPAVTRRMVGGISYDETALAAQGHTPEMIASYPVAP